MKKQTLLALSAGLAITASGLTFANTQNNSFQNGSSNGTTITGYSDQMTQSNDQANTTTDQQDSSNTNSRTFKKKISDAKCGNGRCGTTTNSDSKNNSKNNSSDDTTQNS